MLLITPILETGRFTESQKKALKKLKIETVEDLLYHFPVRYGDYNEFSYIKNLKSGDHAIIYGVICLGSLFIGNVTNASRCVEIHLFMQGLIVVMNLGKIIYKECME